jgi:hypothetical protein
MHDAIQFALLNCVPSLLLDSTSNATGSNNHQGAALLEDDPSWIIY